MGRGFGVILTLAEAEKIKTVWRANNPWATDIWADIEIADHLPNLFSLDVAGLQAVERCLQRA